MCLESRRRPANNIKRRGAVTVETIFCQFRLLNLAGASFSLLCKTAYVMPKSRYRGDLYIH